MCLNHPEHAPTTLPALSWPPAPDSGRPPLQAAAPSPRCRPKLWELESKLHCPVIGTCLSIDALRRIARRFRFTAAAHDEFGMHVEAVGFSQQRNAVSETLQRHLDKTYKLWVDRFARLKDDGDVLALWLECLQRGEVAGPLWAVCSHRAASAATRHRAYGDIHMLSHQAGAAHQADVNRLKQLEAENAALKAELQAQREKGGQRLAEKIQEAELLKRQLAEMEVFACEREALAVRVVELEARCRELEGADGGQKARADALALRLVSAEDRTNAAEARVRDLTRQLEESRCDLVAAEQAMESWLLLDGAPEGDACALSAACGRECASGKDGAEAAMPRLEGRSVLCVGGRPGLVETYRRLVERLGGRFAHHDGGLEDNPRFLDGVLSAADAVICQAGCISHGAYWKLKDHCKRTGKPCVYLKGAGVSSFVRGISEVAEGAVE